MSSRSTSARSAKDGGGAERLRAAARGIEKGARALMAAQGKLKEKDPSMPFGLAGRLLAGGVRASAGKTGIAGLAGGLAFNYLLRRSPASAALLGAAIVGRYLVTTRQEAKDRRAARKAAKSAPPPTQAAPPAPPPASAPAEAAGKAPAPVPAKTATNA